MKIDKAISEGRGLYDAARKHWRLSRDRANSTSYLLAVHRGIIGGVYKGRWVKSREVSGRVEFEGKDAPQPIRDYYMEKLPALCNSKGAQTPIRDKHRLILNWGLMVLYKVKRRAISC